MIVSNPNRVAIVLCVWPSGSTTTAKSSPRMVHDPPTRSVMMFLITASSLSARRRSTASCRSAAANRSSRPCSVRSCGADGCDLTRDQRDRDRLRFFLLRRVEVLADLCDRKQIAEDLADRFCSCSHGSRHRGLCWLRSRNASGIRRLGLRWRRNWRRLRLRRYWRWFSGWLWCWFMSHLRTWLLAWDWRRLRRRLWDRARSHAGTWCRRFWCLGRAWLKSRLYGRRRRRFRRQLWRRLWCRFRRQLWRAARRDVQVADPAAGVGREDAKAEQITCGQDHLDVAARLLRPTVGKVDPLGAAAVLRLVKEGAVSRPVGPVEARRLAFGCGRRDARAGIPARLLRKRIVRTGDRHRAVFVDRDGTVGICRGLPVRQRLERVGSRGERKHADDGEQERAQPHFACD